MIKKILNSSLKEFFLKIFKNLVLIKDSRIQIPEQCLNKIKFLENVQKQIFLKFRKFEAKAFSCLAVITKKLNSGEIPPPPAQNRINSFEKIF